METPLIPDLNALQAQCTETKQPMAFRAQVARVTAKPTKDGGKTYYEVDLADATGALKLKAWADSPAAPWAAAVSDRGDSDGNPCVQVSGTFHRSKWGVESSDWTVQPMSEQERAEFFLGPKALREKQAADWNDLMGFVAGMKDRHFRALCATFIGEHGTDFRRAAAARQNHHARPGGLVEHVAGMMRAADVLAFAYRGEVNRDLLLAGVLFHDCGKLWENQYRRDSFEMPFTATAELCGHIALGEMLVRNLWRECGDREGRDVAPLNKLVSNTPLEPGVWPEDKLLHLIHLILSHHGTKEWGSPVEPRTIEAQLLHFIDNIDAKLEMMRGARLKQKEIAPGVLDKCWPLPGNLVLTPQWSTQ